MFLFQLKGQKNKPSPGLGGAGILCSWFLTFLTIQDAAVAEWSKTSQKGGFIPLRSAQAQLPSPACSSTLQHPDFYRSSCWNIPKLLSEPPALSSGAANSLAEQLSFLLKIFFFLVCFFYKMLGSKLHPLVSSLNGYIKFTKLSTSSLSGFWVSQAKEKAKDKKSFSPSMWF